MYLHSFATAKIQQLHFKMTSQLHFLQSSTIISYLCTQLNETYIMKKEYSRSFITAAKTMSAALRILQKNDGSMSSKELVRQVEEQVELTEWEKEITKKGGIRWQNVYHFSSVDYVKAGFIVKKNNNWYLTPEGEEALKKYTPEEMHEIAQKAYREWRRETQVTEESDEDSVDEEKETIISLEELETKALEDIKGFVGKKNAYEYQDMVAALLRAMGYHTPFIAPKGKDGGVDVIAYVDPLGAQTPRIKVQVKHYNENNTIGAKDVRSLAGILRDGDIGLFVTSGIFSPDAKAEANRNKEYIRLIDGNEFIKMWKEYYHKMSDDDKNMLPLHNIAFLGSNE